MLAAKHFPPHHYQLEGEGREGREGREGIPVTVQVYGISCRLVVTNNFQ